MSNEYIIPGTIDARGNSRPGATLVRLRTPTITPEELIAECEPAEPYGVVQALEAADLVLAELLKGVLEGLRYRDEPTNPRAVWARIYAITLAGIRSVPAAIAQAPSKAI